MDEGALAAPKLQTEQLAQFLAQVPLLQGCPGQLMLQLAGMVEHRAFQQRERLAEAGAPAQHIGIVASGMAVIQWAGPGNNAANETLSPGDVFGEDACLANSAYPARVEAVQTGAAIFVRRDVFYQLLNSVPALYGRFAQLAALRFVRARAALEHAAVKAPQPGAPAAAPATAAAAQATPVDVIPFVEAARYNLTPALAQVVPVRLVNEYRAIPLEVTDNTLTVGMVNPKATRARQELVSALRAYTLKFVAISLDDYQQSLSRLKLDIADGRGGQQASGGPRTRPDYLALQKKETEKGQLVIGDEVVNAFDKILLDALQVGCSDIHIEPEQNAVRVRYRVNGILQERKEQLPSSLAAPLIGRIKILAEMDVTERRLPQDGRIVAMIGKREVNLRVSTLAAARGEKVVIRVLDPSDVFRPLEQVYNLPEVVALVSGAVAAHHGAIIVGGATGSGKSSSLYAMFNERRKQTPGSNFVTVEDPVEYVLPGVTQIPIQVKFGLDFTAVLRSLLRQDPDVIMVAELRDAETSRLTISAALTGHLVLSTIHANNVLTVMQRLEFLGSDLLMLSQALNLVTAQRLVKRLCSRCAQQFEPPQHVIDNLSARGVKTQQGSFYRPHGCERCNQTGYEGRVACAEVLAFTGPLRQELAKNGVSPELLQQAEAAGQFISFPNVVAALMRAKLISPSEALLVVSS